MPQNTTYFPSQVAQFNSNGVFYNGQGVYMICPSGQSTNIDLKMLDDNLITGGKLIVKNAQIGDYCDLQVVDVDNIVGYGAGVVLRQFVTKYYLKDDTSNQGVLDLPYAAKIVTGLYLRAIMTSFGTAPVTVAINYDLHKVLL